MHVTVLNTNHAFLQIEFSALLEVRLMNSTPDQGVHEGVIEGSAANESTPVLGSSKKKNETPVPGNFCCFPMHA